MCEYTTIENIVLSNGKTIKQINEAVSKEVERIYLEGWIERTRRSIASWTLEEAKKQQEKLNQQRVIRESKSKK